jgi:hypothetical protein
MAVYADRFPHEEKRRARRPVATRQPRHAAVRDLALVAPPERAGARRRVVPSAVTDNLRPRALRTPATVANSGLPSGDSAR